MGTKLPNPFGLHDTSGNVYEWCQDWYSDRYTGAPADGSAWETLGGIWRVCRGGYWDNRADFCRSASRYYYSPEARVSFIGFRLARTP